VSDDEGDNLPLIIGVAVGVCVLVIIAVFVVVVVVLLLKKKRFDRFLSRVNIDIANLSVCPLVCLFVCLSIRLSVRFIPVFCVNGLTLCHTFFTAR